MNLTLSRHLGDDDLVRYMDRQLDREGTRRMRAHLAGCAECAARLDSLQAVSARVSARIAELPAEVPDPAQRAMALAALDRARFRRRPAAALGRRALLRAAAVAAILLPLALIGTETGRAWVGGAVLRLSGGHPGPVAETLLGWLGEAPAPVAAADPSLTQATVQATGRAAGAADAAVPHPEPPVRVEGTRRVYAPGVSPPMRFDPAGPDVEIVFQALQDQGAATLEIREGASATGQITGGGAGEALVATADGLLVRNRRTSRADYNVVIPSSFRFVRVRVGEGPEMLIRVTRNKQRWIWTINLKESALQ